MLPVVCTCLKYSADYIKFEIKLPILDKLRRLFVNCGWAHLISPSQFIASGAEIADNIPAVQFNDQSRQDHLVNQSIDRLLRRIGHLGRDDLRAIEWSINEICDNVLNHSNSIIGGLFQLNIIRAAKEVEFLVADAGIGVPNSLRSIKNKSWSDEFALEQSIKQGVTRDSEFGQGNGLFGTYQMATLSGGTFHINSGNAHLVVARNGIVQVRHDERYFNGTLVVCAINIATPALLEQALSFKGEDYQMVDLIETNYEIDDQNIRFVMKDEAKSLGSRRSGFEIRRKINNLLIMKSDARIICDMSGINVMSSSFADEVFGKIAREFGIVTYKEKIIITNLSKINEMLINKAVDQRSRMDI